MDHREHSKRSRVPGALLTPPTGILTPAELSSISSKSTPPAFSLDPAESRRNLRLNSQRRMKPHETTSSWCVVCKIKLPGNRVMKALGSCTCCMFDIGSHIRIFYTGYWHHGIMSDVIWSPDEDRVVLGGSVIHYWKRKDGVMEVIESKLSEFIDKHGVGAMEIVRYCKNQFHSEDTLLLAMRRLGVQKYSFASNNCEHFATYCKTGVMKSNQVDSIKDGAAVGGAALVLTQVAPALFGMMTLGIGLVAAAGYTAIKSLPKKEKEAKGTSRTVCTRLIMADLASPTAPEILEDVKANTVASLKAELSKRLCISGEWTVDTVYMTFPEDYDDAFVKVKSDEDVRQLPGICSLRLMLRQRREKGELTSPRRRQMLRGDGLSARLTACALLLPSSAEEEEKAPEVEMENMTELREIENKRDREAQVVSYHPVVSSFVPCSDVESDDTISTSDDDDTVILQPFSLSARLHINYIPSSDSLAGSEWGDKSVVDDSFDVSA